MTRTLPRLAVALVLAAVALRARAHEVDCAKLAALAVPRADGSGLPVLDPGGLPSLATSPGPILTVDRYPAVVAFDVQIRNLASEPSVISGVSDTLPSDPTRVTSFGEDPRSIPAGGVAHVVYTVQVRSLEDCLATFPVDRLPDAPACGPAREDTFLVTTDSDIAACRAQIRCAPPVAPPPPPPSTCAAPAWTGVVHLPPDGGVTDGNGLAVACDGTTWASAVNVAPGIPAPPEAVFQLDPQGLPTVKFRTADLLTDLHPDPSGGVVALVGAGAGRSTPGPIAWSVRRYDPTFATAWDFPLADLASAADPPGLAVDPGGDVYVGYQRRGDYAVKKLSPSGAILWDASYATTAPAGITVAPDGTVYLAGVAGRGPASVLAPDQTVFVAELGRDGALRSDRRLAVPGNDVISRVTVDPASGRVAVTGATRDPVDGGAPVATQDGFVAVWDASGALAWVRLLRPVTSPGTTSVAVSAAAQVAFDASGALWVGGSVFSGTLDPAQPARDLTGQAAVARFDAGGTPLWVRQFPWGDQGGDGLFDLRVDGAGDGIALIRIHTSLSSHDTALVRIAPDGT